MELAFLNTYFEPKEAGMFQAATNMLSLVTGVPALFCAALMPHFTERMGASDVESVQSSLRSSVRFLTLSLFPASVASFLFAEDMLRILYGGKFVPAVLVLRILLVGAFAGIGPVTTSVLHASGRPWFIAICGLLGAAVSLAANFLLIPLFGSVGGAASKVLVQLLMIFISIAYIQRTMPYRFPNAEVAKIAAASIVAALPVAGLQAILGSHVNLPGVVALGLCYLISFSFVALKWNVVSTTEAAGIVRTLVPSSMLPPVKFIPEV
jgi:O-antigen/teichoic acid export membrane protein